MEITFVDDICVTCLSTDRKVVSIENTDLYPVYCILLNETPHITPRVCPWCAARLRRARALQEAAKAAHDRIVGMATQLSSYPHHAHLPLSLFTLPVTLTSYPAVKLEPDEDGLKTEADDCVPKVEYDAGSFLEQAPAPRVACAGAAVEHQEPEAFVRAIVNLKPQKEKKTKPKKKLKRKIKAKTKSESKKKIVKEIETESISGVSYNSLGDDDYDPGNDASDLGNDASDLGNDGSDLANDGNDPNGEIDPNGADLNDASDIEVEKGNGGREEKIKLAPGERPQCAECGKTFSSRKTYRYHLNVLHRGMNRHPCPRCGKVYQWKSNLGRHMRSHKARDSGELYCAPCDKRFSSVATYRQHLRGAKRHLQDEDYSFSCTQCDKRFASKTRLRDHVDWDHLQKVKFRCQICNKAFKCHTSMYVHTQNVHSERGANDNLCHVCGKSYRNAAKLKYHIVAMHSGSTPYGCERCGASFGWYSSLYRHVREVHHKKKVPNKKLKRGKPPPSPPLPVHSITALI